MKLIIAEKKALRDQIAVALGNSSKYNKFTLKAGDYLLTYLGGHALEFDLKEDKWSIKNLPLSLSFKKRIKSDKSEIISNVKTLLKGVSSVINAGDMDDEGQLLVDEVLEYCGYKGKVERLNTADTTEESLRENLKHLQDNSLFYTQGLSAEARSRADAIFGLNYTQYYTLTSGGGKTISVGRVQTPTLKLLVDRDLDIENFKKQQFTEVYFKSHKDNKECTVKVILKEDDPLLDVNGYLTDKNNIQKLIDEINGKTFNGEVKTSEKETTSPLPFNLATLSVLLEKKYGITPTETMALTQSLRDKYNAISYNRSECEYLPVSYYEHRKEHIKTVLNNLVGEMGDVVKTVAPLSFKEEENFKSKCFDDSKIELHFGIIPQNINIDISKFEEKERNVYIEIAKRYLMQFMGNQKQEVKTLEIDVKNNRIAKAESKNTIKKGWSALNEKERDEEMTLPYENGKGIFLLDTPITKDCETTPPKRFTESTLVKAMTQIARYTTDDEVKKLLLEKDTGKTGDKGSIGTSATRDKVVKTLIERGYAEKKGKNLISTSLGREFIKQLPNSLSSLRTTTDWFLIQNDIRNGKTDIDTLTTSVSDKVKETISKGECLNLFLSTVRETEKSYLLDKGKDIYVLSKKLCDSFKLKMNKENAEKILTEKVKTLYINKTKIEISFKKGDENDKGGNMYFATFNINKG